VQQFAAEVFNHKENALGKHIRVLVITARGLAGSDIPGARVVHLMSPAHSLAAQRQAYGRVLRLCAVANNTLGGAQSNATSVRMYTYVSVPAKDEAAHPSVRGGGGRGGGGGGGDDDDDEKQKQKQRKQTRAQKSIARRQLLSVTPDEMIMRDLESRRRSKMDLMNEAMRDNAVDASFFKEFSTGFS
jgi:superfamily II DNA or RNA helicase